MLSSLCFDLPLPALALLLAVLATAGLVSGLSGFCFSAVGAAILAGAAAARGRAFADGAVDGEPAAVVAATRGTQTPPPAQRGPPGRGRHVAGGLLGLPCGLWVLGSVAPAALIVLFGALLFAYALFSWFGRRIRRVADGSCRVRALVGAAGGLIGGFTAFPGAAVVGAAEPRRRAEGGRARHHAALHPLHADGRPRAAGVVRPDAFGPEFRGLFALCLPVVLPCTLAGVAIYRRMSDHNFRQVTLMLLGVTGIGLPGKGLIV